MPVLESLQSYRHFRNLIISKEIKLEKPNDLKGFARRRKLIELFREFLVEHHQKASAGLNKDFFLKALGLPAHFDAKVKKNRLKNIFRTLTVTVNDRWEEAGDKISQGGNYHGRKLIFNLHVKDDLDLLCYSAELDYTLRKLSPHEGLDQRKLDFLQITVNHLNLPWLRTCYKLGYHNISEILALYDNGISKRDAEKICIIVKSQGMKKHLTTKPRDIVKLIPSDRHYNQSGTLSKTEIFTLKRLTSLFTKHNIGIEGYSRLMGVCLYYTSVTLLEQNFQALSALSGDELTTLFCDYQKILEDGRTEIWTYLVELGVSPEYLPKYEYLFIYDLLPSATVSKKVKESVDDQGDLLGCLPILTNESGAKDEQIISNIDKLIRNYGYVGSDLRHSGRYIMTHRSLESIFSLLDQYGITDSKHTKSFIGLFTHYFEPRVQTEESLLQYEEKILQFLTRLLDHSPIINQGELAAKILESHTLTSLLYLEQQGLLTNASEHNVRIKRVEKVIRYKMNNFLLEYLIEYRGYDTLRQIEDFHINTPGSTFMLFASPQNELIRILADAAYENRNFFYHKDNWFNANDYVSERLTEPNNTVDRSTFIENNAPKMRKMLELNHGVLLPGLPSFEGSINDIKEHFDDLNNTLKKLLDDPRQAISSDVAAQTVAIAFRTTQENVSRDWSCLNFRFQEDNDQPYLQSDKTDFVLIGSAVKDDEGTKSLEQVLEAMKDFESTYKDNMDSACSNLRPKKLGVSSYELKVLTQHFAVALSFIKERDTIVPRVKDLVTSLRTSNVHRQQETLNALSNAISLVNLDDAFINQIPDKDRVTLQAKLAKSETQYSQLKLVETLQFFLDTCLARLTKWLRTKQNELTQTPIKDNKVRVIMAARASKAPAAFFAKHAYNLCTSNNTKMWEEKRHAHMLIFGRDGILIQGMAMLYKESITTINKEKQTLIMRQLMVSQEVLMTFSVKAIVDAFIEAGKDLVEQNDLAALAFPEESGSHILSNIQEIEKAITARCDQIHVNHQHKHKFHAYESSCNQENTISSKLYVVHLNKEIIDSGETKKQPTKSV